MGCTYARPEHTDSSNPRVFKVFNVDEQRQELSAGKIQITESELIWIQKSKAEVRRWPLWCLRRYGYDEQLFSFESGRRCPTGPGIYAFKCRRAEALFNLLQECIQRAGQDDHQPRAASELRPTNVPDLANTTHPVTTSNGILLSETEVPLPTQNNVTLHNYVNETIELAYSHREGEGPDHEYVNTTSVQPRPSPDVSDHRNVNLSIVNVDNETGITYAELDLPKSEDELSRKGSSSDVFLLNGTRKGSTCSLDDLQPNSSQAAYVNVPAPVSSDLSSKRKYSQTESLHSLTGGPDSRKRKITYIKLDLKNTEQTSNSNGPSPASPISLSSSNPESPRRTESYAMIDFNKTLALSTKQPPSGPEDEGCRKTRHNSNIDEL